MTAAGVERIVEKKLRARTLRERTDFPEARQISPV